MVKRRLAPVPARTYCDNCGRRVRRPYRLGRWQGRPALVCGDCVEKIARGIAQAERAVRRRAA